MVLQQRQVHIISYATAYFKLHGLNKSSPPVTRMFITYTQRTILNKTAPISLLLWWVRSLLGLQCSLTCLQYEQHISFSKFSIQSIWSAGKKLISSFGVTSDCSHNKML